MIDEADFKYEVWEFDGCCCCCNCKRIIHGSNDLLGAIKAVFERKSGKSVLVKVKE